jgi:hypothetical protein
MLEGYTRRREIDYKTKGQEGGAGGVGLMEKLGSASHACAVEI